MRPIFLFDLDDTTVSSHHRQRLNSDGTIDLHHWRSFNTAENIAKDIELPLAHMLRGAIRRGLDVGILTSRVMGKADRTWLMTRGLWAPLVMSRELSDVRATGSYKLAQLHKLAIERRESFARLKQRIVLWDDCQNVQKVLKNAGIRVIDPVQYNLTSQQKVAI